jgi:hypothetical protein
MTLISSSIAFLQLSSFIASSKFSGSTTQKLHLAYISSKFLNLIGLELGEVELEVGDDGELGDGVELDDG